MNKIYLGVNIDHVATVRNARGTFYPDPVDAAALVEAAGGDSITIHLREDRRHIKDHDVAALIKSLNIPMNLEMAVTDEMIAIAEQTGPKYGCLVPEKREELTTEGGLDVVGNFDKVKAACDRFTQCGIRTSLFIDPEFNQIDAAVKCGAPAIELHTGCYADAETDKAQKQELARIVEASRYAHDKGLVVNAGHGLNVDNVAEIAAIPEINELNIGHSIVARAVLIGMQAAVVEIKQLMDQARL